MKGQTQRKDLVLCKFCGGRQPREHFMLKPEWGVKSGCYVGICKECFGRVKHGSGKK